MILQSGTTTNYTESLIEALNKAASERVNAAFASAAGTIDNPIIYVGDQMLEQGKYYSQYDVIYYCTKGSSNPVFSDLAELVPLYVEVANG